MSSQVGQEVAAVISPVGVLLRLFLAALMVGPLVASVWVSVPLQAFSLPVILGYLWWRQVAGRIPLQPAETAEPVEGVGPIAGMSKLLALLAVEQPAAIRSLTGSAVVAIDPASGTPVLRDLQPPSRARLVAEACFLAIAAVIWTAGVGWTASALRPEAYVGVMIIVVGSLGALGALLQRRGWSAGAHRVEAEIWAAPLIPATGPNRFRAMVTLDGRILVRPDVLEAPYLPYLLAHERAHLEARSGRLVWLEQLLYATILIATGLSLWQIGWFGILVLALVPLQRLLLGRLSYRSELEADRRAAAAIGVEACLAALAALADEGTPSSTPLWQRYSPTIPERIEELRQRFNQQGV